MEVDRIRTYMGATGNIVMILSDKEIALRSSLPNSAISLCVPTRGDLAYLCQCVIVLLWFEWAGGRIG